MGYRGKLDQRQQARTLRAQSWTLAEIADELRVSKASVSVWVRDVEFVPRPRNRGHPAGPQHPMRLRKLAEIERCRTDAAAWVGAMSHRDLSMFALGLYAGEGSKSDGSVIFANTNPDLVRAFLSWLRQQFSVDDHRLRVRLYLHEDLGLAAAIRFWSAVTGVPPAQFTKPYRAAADESHRTNRHEHGCVSVVYHDAFVHRSVMAMISAITSRFAFRDSSAGRAVDC